MKGLWKGAMGDIPEFWEGGSPNVSGGQGIRYVGDARELE